MSIFATTSRPCACSLVEVDGQGTGCTSTTKSVFAPGHDAKLAGYLSRGEEVTITDGGLALTTDTMTFASQHLSPALAAKVRAGRELASAKAQAKRAKAQAKADAETPAAEVKPTHKPRSAKAA